MDPDLAGEVWFLLAWLPVAGVFWVSPLHFVDLKTGCLRSEFVDCLVLCLDWLQAGKDGWNRVYSSQLSRPNIETLAHSAVNKYLWHG